MTLESEYYEQNIDIFKGTDVPIIVTIVNSTTDISSWTFIFSVRRRAGDSGLPYIEKSTGITVDDNDKTVSFVLDDELTNGLRIGSYFWDLKRSDSGNEKIVASGKFNLLGTAATPI